MPHIGVLFEVRRAETRPGECVSVVGSRPELGSWDPFDQKAVASRQLRTSAAQYPGWAMSAPVWIELGADGPRWRAAAATPDGSEEDEKDSEADEPSDLDSEEDASAPASPSVRRSGAGAGISGHASSGDFVRLEYKYIKDRRNADEGGPSIQWEDSIGNRRVMIPQEHGSIWIVSDIRFNDNTEPTIARTTLAEVLARRGDLDPEWTSQDVSAPEWMMPHREELSSPGSAATSCSRHTTSTIFMM
uniref:CBM20 domain-containing protein n=1 Tax=Zooxanthella nutricula TaxID=1333877 RepID=A0A7S2QMJ7_9DINO